MGEEGDKMGLENYKKIKLNKLKKAPWNYKVEDTELLEKLKKNIQKNGFIQNLIVRELDNNKYEVVNGNHRLQALLDLQYTEAVCFNLGKISEILAKKIAIETNETRFEADSYKLADLIKNIKLEIDSEDLSLPFTEVELSSLEELNENTSTGFDKDDTDYWVRDVKPKKTIKITLDTKEEYEKSLKELSKNYNIKSK